jgi:hypothetical protein
MPLTVTVNTIAECLRRDCNILGDKKMHSKFTCGVNKLLYRETCVPGTYNYDLHGQASVVQAGFLKGLS